MVYVRGHKLPWSLREKRKLLQLYTSANDWPTRAVEMAKEFSDQRGYGFYTGNTCQAEFDRIISEPCPGKKASADGTSTSYSRKAVIESWIQHLSTEIEKEDKQSLELEMVEIRSKAALINQLQSGSKKFTNDEIQELLDRAREEDQKNPNQEQVNRVINAYITRLREVFVPKQDNIEEVVPLPTLNISTTPMDTSDIVMGSLSPTAGSSPIKSPIRTVADVIRETQVEISTQDVDMEPDSPQTTTEAEAIENRSPDVATAKRKARSGKKEPKKENPSEESSSGEKSARRSRVPPETTNTSEETPSVDQQTPTNIRRRAKTSLPVSAVRGGKKSINKDMNETIDDGDSRSSSRRAMDTKEASVLSETHSILETSNLVSRSEPGSVGTSSEISIRGALWSHQEKKERRVTIPRKSTRRSEVTEDTESSGPHRSIGVQTKRIEFDKEDVIHVSWTTNDRVFVRTIPLDVKKKEEIWSDEEELASGNKKESDPDEPEEKRLKYDNKKEFQVIYETDEWLANALCKQPGFALDVGKVIQKRQRTKEERRDDPAAQNRSILMNMWQNVICHKHSGIFGNPVNDKDAPGYGDTVRRKMDMSTLRREIENGGVTTKTQMKMRLNLMFANAIMFNSTGHDVHEYAKEMATETNEEWIRVNNADPASHSVASRRSSKYPTQSRRSKSGFGTPQSGGSEDTSRLSAPDHSQTVPTGKTRKVFLRKTAPTEVHKIAV